MEEGKWREEKATTTKQQDVQHHEDQEPEQAAETLRENDFQVSLNVSEASSLNHDDSTEDDETSMSEQILNNDSDQRINIFNFALVNARSVAAKLPSLVDMFTELDLSVVLLTETWFRTNKETRDELPSYCFHWYFCEKIHRLKQIICVDFSTKVPITGASFSRFPRGFGVHVTQLEEAL